MTNYEDGIYANADPSINWDDALLAYAKAVDSQRHFEAHPIGADAMNPMWHSWYAHGFDINQGQLLEDARDAAALGVKTIEIDAGWNMIGYNFRARRLLRIRNGRDFPSRKG